MHDNFAIKITELEEYFGEEINLNTYGVNSIIEKIIEMDIIPLNNYQIKFSDDVWKFSSDGSSKDKNKLKFYDFPECYVRDIKAYALIVLLENTNKLQSIDANLFRIKTFLNYCYKQGIYYFEEITASDIVKFKKDSNMSLGYEKLILSAVLNLFKVYSYNFRDILTNELKEELSVKYDVALAKHIEENKTPYIPAEYFLQMKELFTHTINDKKETLNNRITASALLLLSQTGLRISEILELYIDSMDFKTLHNKKRVPYLKYTLRKSISGNNGYRIIDIFMNEVSEFAFVKLVELTKSFRGAKESDYLVILPRTKRLPLEESTFFNRNVALFATYDKALRTINRTDKPDNLSTVKYRKHKTIKTITYPTTIQYRVTVCTNLYEKGVPLPYIRKFMGHLSTEMEGYYVRNTNEVQEDIEFSKQTMEGIVSGDLKILGKNANQMTRDIQKFVDENKIAVEKDVESIVDKLLDSVPIRAKLGGVCIKSSPFRDCTKDYQTNELYCAYNVCPNVFHFFYMCELSFRQCKELEETINVNFKNGYLRQVEKESLLLGRIVNDKLLPELEELNIQIKSHGEEKIKLNYPDLESIINNYDDIILEAETWKNIMSKLGL